MLPYQQDKSKLEKLLERLFEDDDKPTPEDVEVLGWPRPPRPFSGCCTYNYSSYTA